MLPILHGAQNKTELERKLEENRQKIKLAEQILKQTKSQKESTLAEFLAMEQKIKMRSGIITGLEDSIARLGRLVDFLQDDIAAVNREIENMTRDFETLLVEGYKLKKYNRNLQFLLNSSTFNELILKKKYLDRILEYKKLQLRLIYEKKRENSVRVEALLHKKQDQIQLLESKKKEQVLLAQNQEKRNNMLSSLSKKEADLKAEIARERKNQIALNKQIAAAIKKERAGTKSVPKFKDNSGLSFSDLRGRLPWPIKDGYVTQRFGVHRHPTLKNVNTQNNGIDITVPKNSKAICVHDGVITAVLQVPGMHTSVLVNHGGYFTVYANLTEAFVQKGQKLAAGDVVGLIFTDEEGTSKLHFEIWEGSRKINPEAWLMKKS